MSSPIEQGRSDDLAANLKALRDNARLSLAEVAAAVGVTKTAVHAWEQGSQPGKDKLERLAALYGTTVQELRFGPPGVREPAASYQAIPREAAARLRLRILEIERELLQAGADPDAVRDARELLEHSERSRFLTFGEFGAFDLEKALRFVDGLREVIRLQLGLKDRTSPGA